MPTESKNNRWNAAVKPEARSTVKIEGEIPYTELLKHRGAALAELGEKVSIDGFRKGHVPEKALLDRFGEMALLAEMAERALAIAYPEMLHEHTIDALGRPEIRITKLAPNNPLGFSITVAVVPSVTLPEYKKIAQATQKESAEVTNAEFDDMIKNMVRQKKAYERMQQKATAKKHAGKSDLIIPTPETIAPDTTEMGDDSVPALTDEYIKTLGEFSSVDDFKTKLREYILKEKAQETIAKHRAAITDAIVEASEIELPQVLVDAEIGQVFGQMKQDLDRANLKVDDYLDHIKKTKEELVAEWTPAAEKRAKLQLILNEIAKQEKIEAPAEKVDTEVARLLEQYKDVDKERVRLYVASILTNDEVLKMLEIESANGSPS